MIRISRAKKMDLKEVARLRFWAQRYSASFDPDVVISGETEKNLEKLTEREFQDPRIVYLLAKENSRAIGLAILSVSPETDQTAFLGELFIEERFRRKGLGRQLVHKAMEIAKRKRLKKFRISVNRKNKLAQKFYHQLGFQTKKREYLLLEKEL